MQCYALHPLSATSAPLTWSLWRWCVTWKNVVTTPVYCMLFCPVSTLCWSWSRHFMGLSSHGMCDLNVGLHMEISTLLNPVQPSFYSCKATLESVYSIVQGRAESGGVSAHLNVTSILCSGHQQAKTKAIITDWASNINLYTYELMVL